MEPYNPQKIEEEALKHWVAKKTYEKAKDKRKNGKPYYFIDGPPYASGSIHLGTAMNKIIKDCYIRFFRMQGFNVWDQPGYDTHGTPIEVKVEKQLGFTNKKDIEKYGMGKFIKKCREFATKYIDVMNKQFAGLGVWMDWDNPYLTLHNRYIEGAWFTFKRAYENKFLYKGSYPVHACSRCETVVAYNEVEYQNLTDTSIYVKFPVKGKPKTYFAIWTTTPWTIPSNTGIMVNPKFDYSYVKIPTGETLIIAKELVEKIMSEIIETGNYKIVKTVKGKDLNGMVYEHPLTNCVPALQNLKNGHRVVLSSRYVTLDSGTGLVHAAPGHGTEDFIVGKETGLPVVSPVKIDGTYKKEAGSWLAGKYVKDMDHVIIEKLNERGVLLGREEVSHDYPICWRCSTPLLFINIPQWFLKVEDIRKNLIVENKKVNWVPSWAKKRMNDWLENLGDWPISRQRFWGIPLPIWECKCGNTDVIGSLEELKKKSGLKKEVDFHRPEIDTVKWKCSCGEEMKRIPDVLDVWFDSGVCTWASLGYPRDKKLFQKFWPSDFQLEGPDQFRGWWNSQMITSYVTFKKAPYKNILLHGFIMDAKGIKLSKSKGNAIDPIEISEREGKDIFRFYMLSNPPWNNFYFSFDELKETKRFFNVFWNVYQFIKTYSQKVTKTPELNVEDKWIISKLNSILESAEHGSNFHMHKVAQELKEFILNDFSRWYIKLIRDRVSPSYVGKDKAGAQYTLNIILETVARALAPISPFLTDHIYRDLFGESVHFEDYPKPDKRKIDSKLEKDMESVKIIFEALTTLRQEKEIRLRWPVDKVFVQMKTPPKQLADIIKYICNVKDVAFVSKLTGKGKEFEGGSLTLGKALMDEAFVRELTRKTQQLRKEAKLQVSDTISLYLNTDKDTEQLIEKFKDDVLKGTSAKSLEFSSKEPKGVLEFEGKNVSIGFKK
ncbi:MAG: isoleucine--tRNA ligase [Candidatus Aenigmarchaeota archaeon]|nr:isoleucine--tRNA ligase [Candidatus Aenigmarchaeota archaeon]